MTSARRIHPRLAILAFLALSLGTARADDDVVERVDSKNITVTEPKADAAVAKDAKMSVEGTVKVAPGANAPAIVIAKFTGGKKLELGSYSLRLNDEENEYGIYQFKDGAYKFHFKVKAPGRTGKCALTVETIEASGPKIHKERSKPITIQVR